MAENSKLEVFKVNIGRDTFRERVIKKCKLNSQTVSDNEVFNSLYEIVLQKLTQVSAWTHNKIKLGLTLFSNEGEGINEILSSHSDCCIIEGYIDGGPYDRIRTLAEKDNVRKRSILGRDKIVTDRYYIFMYFPLESNIGMIFIERKVGQDIHKPIEIFIKEVFKGRSKVSVERYVPQALIEKYRTEGVIDTLTFTDKIVSPELEVNEVETSERTFDVTVMIKPQKGESYNYEMMNEFLDSVGDYTVKIGNSIKRFVDFRTKKARIRKDNDSYSFSVGDDFKIRPMVEIEEEVHDREHDVLKRREAFDMVSSLLNQIKEDVYPVQED